MFKFLLIILGLTLILTNITPTYAAYSCQGVIKDGKSGIPLSNVSVEITHTDSTKSSLTANFDGSYQYSGEKSIRSFMISKEGYKTLNLTALKDCLGDTTLNPNDETAPAGPDSLCSGAVSLNEIPSCAQAHEISTPKLHTSCPVDTHAFSCDTANANLCMNGESSARNVVCKGSSNSCGSLGIKITPDKNVYGVNQDIVLKFEAPQSYLNQLDRQSKYVLEFMGKTGVIGGVNVGANTIDPFNGDFSKINSTLLMRGGLSKKDDYQVYLKETNRASWFGQRDGYAYLCGGPQIRIQEENTEKTVESNFPVNVGSSTCVGNKCTSSGGTSCNTKDGKAVKIKDQTYYDENNNPVDSKDVGILTAIGCLPTQPKPLIEGLLKFAAAIGGGVAFLLILAGVFQFITSAGNQDSLKKASEQITNAVIGLLFIIFSVLLLRIIGVDILGILPP